MKTFSHCPKCKDPMRSEPCGGPVGERWRIVCDKHLDHDVLCLTVPGHDDLLFLLCVAIRMTSGKNDRIYANWDFDKEELRITKGMRASGIHDIFIPYFYPNLGEYDKLIKKLLTYRLFS